MRVLVVEIVLAGVHDRQLPERRHVHHFVEDTLSERALTEEANRDLIGTPQLRGHRRTRCDPGRAADDCVCAEVAVLMVGDVHRAPLAAAVPGLLAQQLGKHPLDRRSLGKTVAMATMRAGDVVGLAQGFADADGDRLFPDVQVCESRHLRAAIQLVDPFLERADRDHTPVGSEPPIGLGSSSALGLVYCGHVAIPVATPDIWARTSKIAAKSCSASPIARAAVRSSLVTAVVGSGTSS